MNYLIAQLQEDMIELQDEEWDIRIDRGQRYGGKDDTLENIATFGADGAIVHANECFNRIKNMFGQVKDLADLKDAVMDGRNYLAYIYILETRALGQGEYNIPPNRAKESIVASGVVPWESQRNLTTDPIIDEVS